MGALPQAPKWPLAVESTAPRPPNTASQQRIFGYAPALTINFFIPSLHLMFWVLFIVHTQLTVISFVLIDLTLIRIQNSTSKQGCRSLLSIGRIICNFTPILAYFSIRGDEPWPPFFSGKQIKWNWKIFLPEFKWRPKKKVVTENGGLFFPEFKRRPALRCTPESNYWGNADADHTQIIGRDTVKLLGGDITRFQATWSKHLLTFCQQQAAFTCFSMAMHLIEIVE